MRTSHDSLDALIKRCPPGVKNFIRALKAENLKAQKQVAKLQAEKVSLQNRIRAMETEIKTQGSGAIRKLMDDVAKRERPQPNPTPNTDARLSGDGPLRP